MSKMSLPEAMIGAVLPHAQPDGRFGRGDDFADVLSMGKAAINPIPARLEPGSPGFPVVAPPFSGEPSISHIPALPEGDSPSLPLADPPISPPGQAVITPVIAPPSQTDPSVFSSGSLPSQVFGTPLSATSWVPTSPEVEAPKSGEHAFGLDPVLSLPISAAVSSQPEIFDQQPGLLPLRDRQSLSRNATAAGSSVLALPIPSAMDANVFMNEEFASTAPVATGVPTLASTLRAFLKPLNTVVVTGSLTGARVNQDSVADNPNLSVAPLNLNALPPTSPVAQIRSSSASNTAPDTSGLEPELADVVVWASPKIDDTVRAAAPEPSDVLQTALFADAPVWSRVYPQHWFANAYLSVVDAQKRGAGGSARSMPVGSGGVSERHGEVQLVTSGITDTGSDITDHSVAAPAFLRGSESPAPVNADESTESVSGALGSAMAADHVWAERLVRITRDCHGVSTVWLRDYTLNEAAIDPLVRAMKRHAHREGVEINRVVVNGREVWRAAFSPEGN